MRFILRLLVGIASVLGAQSAIAAPHIAMLDGVSVELRPVLTGLDQPVFLTAPAGDPRLFVIEKTGRIRLIKDGALQPNPFLDIHDQVSGDQEQGLLGLAFDPDYSHNGRFFVDFTKPDNSIEVAAYKVSADQDLADPASHSTILAIPHPGQPNHNGGWLGFGPDGDLYIGVGDGGGEGDVKKNGQNPNVLLAKILRIDVNAAAPYAIPPTNPFAKSGGAPEIFITGARNPWRISFDGPDLYVADVGQDSWEEVTVLPKVAGGENLGWSTMEGAVCYRPHRNCDVTGITQPAYVYSHDDGCSITGGYVYRGAAIPALRGRYFFADFCSANVQSFRFVDGKAMDYVDVSKQGGRLGAITSFGLDSSGELYVLVIDGGLFKLVPGP